MTKAVPLSTGIGEVLAPQLLVTALVLSPAGELTVDAGALHGRSAVESQLRLATTRDALKTPQLYWLIWVAVALDAANSPQRYKGIAASELWVDPASQSAYKVLAEHVNRIADAMLGRVTLKTLGPKEKTLIRRQLAALDAQAWERSDAAFKDALSS